jgi:hypothetical protein
MLQIKIERAKDALPKETLKAINSVDWRAAILGMKEKKGYSFEQLEDLELETELLLCGLLLPENYPKELESRMGIPKSQVDLLVSEMNELVFKKIKDELIKNSQREEIFTKKNENIDIKTPAGATINKDETGILTKAGIKITDNVDKLPTTNYQLNDKEIEAPKPQPVESISAQKLSGSFQIPTTTTEYALPPLQKDKSAVSNADKPKLSKGDPYRLDPNEG